MTDQELWETIKALRARIMGLERENRELKEQNKRHREALEFYADENNYREQELKGIVPPRPITFKPILHDYGSIARQALEGESDA